MRTEATRGLCVEVELTHPAAAFAATVALEGMSEAPVQARGVLVRVSVPERGGAIMEAARRLSRAGVGVYDIALRGPEPMSASASCAREAMPSLR